MPCFFDSISQLNILYGGVAISLIESAHDPKYFSSDSATGTPESRGFFGGRLVNIVVEQIFILGKKVGGIKL